LIGCQVEEKQIDDLMMVYLNQNRIATTLNFDLEYCNIVPLSIPSPVDMIRRPVEDLFIMIMT